MKGEKGRVKSGVRFPGAFDDCGQDRDELIGLVREASELIGGDDIGRSKQAQPVIGFPRFLVRNGDLGNEVLLWLPCASSTFAPTDVPERSNWLARVRETPGDSSSARQSLTMRVANSNVRSLMSLGSVISLFSFHFSLFPASRGINLDSHTADVIEQWLVADVRQRLDLEPVRKRKFVQFSDDALCA